MKEHLPAIQWPLHGDMGQDSREQGRVAGDMWVRAGEDQDEEFEARCLLGMKGHCKLAVEVTADERGPVVRKPVEAWRCGPGCQKAQGKHLAGRSWSTSDLNPCTGTPSLLPCGSSQGQPPSGMAFS